MIKRAEVVDFGGLRGHRGAEPAIHLEQQRTDAFGKHRDLLLFQYHRHHPGVVHRLDVEGAISGLADSPGHEAVGCAENMNCAGHGTSKIPADARRSAIRLVARQAELIGGAADHGVARRHRIGRLALRLSRLRRRWIRLLAWAAPARNAADSRAPVWLTCNTNGRSGVYRITLTDAGSAVTRWKPSRCMP